MSVHDPREVIVDDNDNAIHYSPEGWKLVNGQAKNGKGRTPYMNSLHVTTGKASLSYSFRGSNGRILGKADTSDSPDEGPFWQCFLDGKLLPGPQSNSPDQKNNDWLLCEWDSVLVGLHTVTLNVTSNGKNDVSFDRLLYQPDIAQVVKNSTIFVPHSDPAIKYGFGWKDTSNSHIAPSSGANLTFPFVGSGLSWYGIIPKQSTQNLSVTFSIDGGHFQLVPMGGDPQHDNDKSQTQFNRLFFQTPQLNHGQHNLTVISKGTPDLAPLALFHLVLDNSELPSSNTIPSSTTPSSTSIGTTTSSSGSTPHSKGKNYHGSMTFKEKMIIGAVIGALVLFFLALFTFMFLRRRRRRRINLNKNKCEESADVPNTSQVLKSGQRVTVQPAFPEYPFAQQSSPQLLGNQYHHSPAKRLTNTSSTRDRPNSLFPIARLSALPTKGEPSTPRTYRPYVSRRFRFSNFSSSSRQTTSSSVTLLPSPKRSFHYLFDDDQTVVMGHRDSGWIQSHNRPPEATELPPYSAG